MVAWVSRSTVSTRKNARRHCPVMLVVIDPFLDNCTVITGSHNLGHKALFNTGHLIDLTREYTHIATTQGVSFSTPINGTFHGGSNGSGIAGLLLPGMDADFQPLGSWRQNATVVPYSATHLPTKNIITVLSSNNNSTTLNRFLGGQDDNLSFSGHTRDWRGPNAEIIAYTSSVSAVNVQKIESYLGIKSGLLYPLII